MEFHANTVAGSVSIETNTQGYDEARKLGARGFAKLPSGVHHCWILCFFVGPLDNSLPILTSALLKPSQIVVSIYMHAVRQIRQSSCI